MVSYRVRRVSFKKTASGQLGLLTKLIEPKTHRIAYIHLSLFFGCIIYCLSADVV